MSKQPNILFLMSDEHRFDVSGFAGNSIVQTPNLDKLAKDSVVFTNAYTPSPVCIPARQCLISGQFPRTCGVEVFGEDLKAGYLTFPRFLSNHGYATVACGKLHAMGEDQMQGFLHKRGAHDSIERNVAHSMIPNKWSDAKEILRAGIGEAPHRFNDSYALLGAKDYLSRFFLDSSYDRQTPDKPLMLMLSLEKPHYPYLTTKEKFEYYLSRVKEYDNQEISTHPFLSKRQVQIGTDVTKRDVIRTIAAYYGMIEEMDAIFGDLLAHLAYLGQNLDDWIVVYTSDHGEMLGEHGIWEKQKFFEASVRVPLLIRYPKLVSGSQTISQNVNLCDLFATFCDMISLPVPDHLNSRSLLPLMLGETMQWNNESISQYGGQNLMIKKDDLKYQSYGSDLPEVLFDLRKDPLENINYIEDPSYQEWVNYFRERRKELCF